MNKPFCLATLAAGFLTVSASHLPAQAPAAPHPLLLPLPPAELLTLLPVAPKGWETKQSRARNTYAGWLFAEASREFSHPAPAPAAGAAAAAPSPEPTPAPPWITRVKILDCGFDPSATADFENFKPGKTGSGESLVVNGLPANLSALGPGGERLRVAVRRRFVVQIETLHQPANSGVAWAKTIDFSRFSSIPDAGPDKLPKPVLLVTVDELDPKKNSVSKMQWMSDEDMQAAAQATPSR